MELLKRYLLIFVIGVLLIAGPFMLLFFEKNTQHKIDRSDSKKYLKNDVVTIKQIIGPLFGHTHTTLVLIENDKQELRQIPLRNKIPTHESKWRAGITSDGKIMLIEPVDD